MIKKPASGQWYISFNYVVPPELREFYPRGTKRFKKYGDINMYSGKERDTNAQELLQDWKFFLKNFGYNPFEEELLQLGYVIDEQNTIQQLEQRIQVEEEKAQEAQELCEEDRRKLVPMCKAFEIYIQNIENTNDNSNSLSTYKGSVKWLTEYLEAAGRINDPISSIKHLDISMAVMEAKKTRGWGNTNYNKEVNMAMTIFNWLALEEYIYKNPSSGRIKKLSMKKTIHRWYDLETADLVKKTLFEKCMPVFLAAGFTYYLGIRSKKELMKLKVGDIDTQLKRVRFTAELSKNNVECFRDYEPEFDILLDLIGFDKLPKYFYVFGKGGEPSDQKCHKDLLADLWRPIRDELALGDEYTIYSWKHTSVIHMMMKGISPYDIQYKLRHDSLKTTEDYMRDFDLSKKIVYQAQDLTYYNFITMTPDQINDLEARLHGLKLPEAPFELRPGTTIHDIDKFIHAQFTTLRHAPDAKTSLPCQWRLEEFIQKVEEMQ